MDEEQLKFQQQISQLETTIRPYFTKKALERLLTIKIAHPELYVQAMAIVAQLVQQGRIKQLEDEDFKEILKKLSVKKEFKINK